MLEFLFDLFVALLNPSRVWIGLIGGFVAAYFLWLFASPLVTVIAGALCVGGGLVGGLIWEWQADRTAQGEPAAFDANYGMALMHQNKFDQSAKYFEKHLAKNAVAHYGLALSKFRKDAANLSVAELKAIVELFEEALALSPNSSDAYFMCAMAYNQAAGLQLGSYNKNRISVGTDTLREPDTYLAKAEQYFRKAIALNPAFSGIAEREMGLNQRLKAFSTKLKAEL